MFGNLLHTLCLIMPVVLMEFYGMNVIQFIYAPDEYLVSHDKIL